MLKLIIQEIAPSNNKLLRMHFMDRYKLFNSWTWQVKAQIMELQETLGLAKTKKKVKIISYRKRLLDKDNLYGSCKPILDALIKNGLILDDSEKWIILKVRQEIDGKNVRTEITIT